MYNFNDQLARHVIEQKYKVSSVYKRTGSIRGMEPFPPFVRLIRNGKQTSYSLDVARKVHIFNSNWSRK